MIGNYTELYPLLRTELPGITDPLLLQHVQHSGREWCRRTESWTEDIDYNIVDADEEYDDAYDAAIVLGYSVAAAKIAGDAAHDAALEYTLKPHYDSEILRPQHVWTDGDTEDEPMNPSLYEFRPSSQKLIFYDPLQTYSPTAEAWVTATAYTVGQYVISSSLRYLCSIAHTSGTFATDLAAYKWKLMPNDLIVRAVLMPRLFCCELAGWFMEKWAEAIIAGAKAELMQMRDKAWSDPNGAIRNQIKYSEYVNQALRERMTENKNVGITFLTKSWVP